MGRQLWLSVRSSTRLDEVGEEDGSGWFEPGFGFSGCLVKLLQRRRIKARIAVH